MLDTGFSFAALCLHPRDAAALRWFYGESEGAMGLRSTFGAQLDRARLGLGRRQSEVTMHDEGDMDRRIQAADDARQVARRLARLEPDERKLLAAAYGPGLPREQEEDWAWLATRNAPVALLLLVASWTKVGRRQLRAARPGQGTDAEQRAGRALVTRLQTEARLRLAAAHQHYDQTAPRRPPRAAAAE